MSKNIAKTIKLAAKELEEFKQVYYMRFRGAAPVSDSALLRHMAIRGCEAMKAEMNADEKVNKKT